MSFAGASAVSAALVLLASAIFIVVFFATDTEAWGRANDATIALFAALMIAPAMEIYRRYEPGSGPVLGVCTFVGIAGMLVIVVTSALTAAAMLDWLLSAKIGAVGFGGFLIWMAAASVLIVRRGGLPDSLGRFGLVTVGIVAVAVGLTIRHIRVHGSLSGQIRPPTSMWVVFAIAFLCFPAWTVWLGISLMHP